MLPSLLQTTMKETSTEGRVYAEEVASASADEAMPIKTCENGDQLIDKAVGKVLFSREGSVVLQWGQRKRSRCSRVDNHLKHSTMNDEVPLLLRKMVRVTAEKVLPTGTLNGKNGMPEHSQLPPLMDAVHTDDAAGGRRRATTHRGEHSDRTKEKGGASSKGIKGACSNVPSQKKSLHPSCLSKTLSSRDRNPSSPCRSGMVNGKTRTSPDRNTNPSCRSGMVNGGGIQFAAATVEVDWPKFLISLSRKEKEDDFLVIKGTKLPQRPKRRPKVVERALGFCTPGSWLTDLSRGRYDVTEKKCVKKKPTGLKAMETMDSDSD